MKKTKYRVIWIDDQRNPAYPLNWKSVIPKEFANLVENEYPQIIWLKGYKYWKAWAEKNYNGYHSDGYIDCFCLDHDLGEFNADGKEYTGVDVANDIVYDVMNWGKKLPYYECHSSNPCGLDNIVSIFETYKKYHQKQLQL